MLQVDIPGFRALNLRHLVLDCNGTLAVDGHLLAGVGDAMIELSAMLSVHAVTADTYGTAAAQLSGLPCAVTVLGAAKQDEAKLDYVRRLGAHETVCIGNGRNDRLMLKEAALGIAVLEGEGAAVDACRSAHVVVPGILQALELLQHPRRLVATLRA